MVSVDFGWHCTDMFYRPSPGVSVATLLQSMRLCGIYKDNIPLTCYLEKRYQEDLHKGHQLQEDIFRRLENGAAEERDIPAWLEEQRFLEDKLPKARLIRKGGFGGALTQIPEEDDGMSLDEFFGGATVVVAVPVAHEVKMSTEAVSDMDAGELERLTNPHHGMFKKWANLSNTTAIARFMQQGLDPRKEYTKKEMSALCKEHRVQFGQISSLSRAKGRPTYGKIIEETGHGGWRLHSALVEAFENSF